jgi:hypothetical protein
MVRCGPPVLLLLRPCGTPIGKLHHEDTKARRIMFQRRHIFVPLCLRGAACFSPAANDRDIRNPDPDGIHGRKVENH